MFAKAAELDADVAKGAGLGIAFLGAEEAIVILGAVVVAATIGVGGAGFADLLCATCGARAIGVAAIIGIGALLDGIAGALLFLFALAVGLVTGFASGALDADAQADAVALGVALLGGRTLATVCRWALLGRRLCGWAVVGGFVGRVRRDLRRLIHRWLLHIRRACCVCWRRLEVELTALVGAAKLVVLAVCVLLTRRASRIDLGDALL